MPGKRKHAAKPGQRHPCAKCGKLRSELRDNLCRKCWRRAHPDTQGLVPHGRLATHGNMATAERIEYLAARAAAGLPLFDADADWIGKIIDPRVVTDPPYIPTGEHTRHEDTLDFWLDIRPRTRGNFYGYPKRKPRTDDPLPDVE